MVYIYKPRDVNISTICKMKIRRDQIGLDELIRWSKHIKPQREEKKTKQTFGETNVM